jgi:cystathionine gamma-synthase
VTDLENTLSLRQPTVSQQLARLRLDGLVPTRPAQTLTALEGGADTLLFASGMAAATSLFLALRPGDHVVIPRIMYWALRSWLTGFATGWGLVIESADTSDAGALRAAIRPGRTRLVWLETPANPLWTISDIAAAAEAAHSAGALLAVDSTVATPVLTHRR